jgi:hypothetical protein
VYDGKFTFTIGDEEMIYHVDRVFQCQSSQRLAFRVDLSEKESGQSNEMLQESRSMREELQNGAGSTSLLATRIYCTPQSITGPDNRNPSHVCYPQTFLATRNDVHRMSNLPYSNDDSPRTSTNDSPRTKLMPIPSILEAFRAIETFFDDPNHLRELIKHLKIFEEFIEGLRRKESNDVMARNKETKLRHKERTLHRKLRDGDLVMHCNSRSHLYQRRYLKFSWSGPYIVQQVLLHDVLMLWDKKKGAFKVNGKRVKLYNPEEPIGGRVKVFFTNAKSN